MIRINYAINGYDKLIIGNLESEDEHFFVVKARDGVIFRIAKTTVTEVKEDVR